MASPAWKQTFENTKPISSCFTKKQYHSSLVNIMEKIGKAASSLLKRKNL